MTNLPVGSIGGLVVGLSLMVGALIAVRAHLHETTAALITSYGGGILLAAVALELVPEADARTTPLNVAIGLLAGTLIYLGADKLLSSNEQRETMHRSAQAAAAGGQMMPGVNSEAERGSSIAIGIFIDGVPESMALGLTIAGGEIGIALAAGILIGNVTEAYGAVQPMLAGGYTTQRSLRIIGSIAGILVLATIAGGTVLASAPPDVIGISQAIAAGAVLAVLAVAIIPNAFEKVSREVAIALMLGFVTGYALG
jgi:ZIP family zinc transporter